MRQTIINTAFFALLGLSIFQLKAQKPGDTIRVKTFYYGSNTRDTIAHFPSDTFSFEKIILRYNMRCKNGYVSDGSNRSKGCGEWDYSCNTFIIDSSKIETEAATTPNYVITNFTGSSFDYSKTPTYDYKDFAQTKVVHNSTTQEFTYNLGSGSNALSNVLKTDEKSGKTQMLYRKSELLASGFTAGNIDGLALTATAAGTAGFFKIRIKQVSASSLNANQPDNSGFTEVFNYAYSFAVGSNKVLFHTPFAWDGNSNLLIEFSFTNKVPSSAVTLTGFQDTTKCTLWANNNYALDLSSNGHAIIDASKMGSINKEITVAFWAYGDPKQLPANTSVIYGYDANKANRALNIHFPWSDGSVYFDCGWSASAYDRIDKAATTSEQAGKWNHWAFTKNATTGAMTIYVNGAVWLSGTGKTKPISILNMVLGKDQNLNNNYKGKLNELSVWNKALSATEIQNWVNKPLDNSHPSYSNLLAYYPMTEGSGQTITDKIYSLNSGGTNLQWTYDRGDRLSRSFFVSNQKPNLTILRGTYSITKTKVTVRDSIARNINTIRKYSIISQNGVIPVTHDIIKLDTTLYAYQADPSLVYNGYMDTVTGSVNNTIDGNYVIINLNYTRRYPWYNEIMSFVTPYGVGIDLGLKGKNWFYDLTDFSPLLRGNKRIVMTMGGQYQENMDLEFLFIVGTPPAKVLEFNQLWQGGARIGGPGIGSILNNNVFAPITVPILSAGKHFKMRSTVTGHGSDGEFEQNGGPITHYINFNGAGGELNWSLNTDCSTNPLVAQGGTWLIPRQGWCPGLRSKLLESDVTGYLTPGTPATIDYSVSNPQKSGGDYRYIAAHQLVTCGAPNFNLDARILDIKAPTDNFEFAKRNPICSDPLILVQNTGKTTVTTIKFDYWANNSGVKQTWEWAGNLKYMDTISIHLPVWGLWSNGMEASKNVFHVAIKTVNGAIDEYALNNQMSSPVTIPDVITGQFKLEVRTNNNPKENKVVLYDVDGNVVSSNTYTDANKLFTYPFDLNGCYKLVVTDDGIDGMYWWANSAQGSGLVRLRNSNNVIVKTFNMDFGSFFEYNFTTNYALNAKTIDLNTAINLYPNPATDQFSLEGERLENADIFVWNILGKNRAKIKANTLRMVNFKTSDWKPGVYLVEIVNGSQRAVKKVVVY